MNFNSLFQMYAMRKAGNVALENADKILFIPDALSYMLTKQRHLRIYRSIYFSDSESDDSAISTSTSWKVSD